MKSVRLTEDIEKLLAAFAEEEEMNQSMVIREAVVEYIERRRTARKPGLIGAHLIGNYGSGDGSLSSTYKAKLQEKAREKFAR
jgi:metal-responsive CopG/Arc/MetJ family transcriptional regulator